jgi:hypothetical protein
MDRFHILLFTLVVFSATVLQAQAQAPLPQPDPALQKLAVYVGQWTYKLEYQPGPLGPAGKAAGSAISEMILGGSFLHFQWREHGVAGELEGLDILGYDPLNKNYPVSWYQNDGSLTFGTCVNTGRTFQYSGKAAAGGKQYFTRVTETFAEDFLTFNQKGEFSVDSKTLDSLVRGQLHTVQAYSQEIATQ